MPVFSLRGSTALIALSLALALPGAAPAQDTPAPVVAEAAAWQPVTRFGLTFEVPPGAQVTDDTDSPGPRDYAVSTIGAEGTGLRLGLRFLSPEDRARGPALDSPEIEGFLSGMADMPVAATGAVLELGGRRMRAFGGNGPVTGAGGTPREARMLFLVAEEPDADGDTLLIAVFSVGLGGAAAAEMEAHFVASLRPADEAAPPATTDDDGASTAPAGDAPTGDDPLALAAQEPETPDAPPSAIAAAPEAAATGAPAAAPESAVPDADSDHAVAQAAALAAFAPLPSPTGETPPGWTRAEAFGFSLAVPPDASVRDRLSGSPPRFEATLRRHNPDTMLEIVLSRLGPREVAQMGFEPGSDAFRAALDAEGEVPVAAPEAPVMLGEQPMQAYVALGTRHRPPMDGAHEFGVFLVTTAADAEGNWTILGVQAKGYPPEEAQRVVAQVYASMTHGTAPPAATPEPAAPEPGIDLLNGIVGLDLPAGLVVAGENHGARSSDLYLAEAASPAERALRVTAGTLRRGIAEQVGRMLHRIDAVVEAEIDGQPVWVVHGIATRSLADRRAGPDEAVPAQIVAPRFCVDGEPPVMVGILGAPGEEARIDALLPALRFAAPPGARPCDDAPAAALRAAMAAQQPPAPPPAPAVPADWQRQSRFGLTFAAPPGMQVQHERTGRDQLEFSMQDSDASGALRREIALRVFTPVSIARLPHSRPDEAGFTDMLSSFASLPVAETPDRVRLGTQTLRVFRGAGTEAEGTVRVDGRVTYLVPEAPDAQGLSPWFALHGINQSEADYAAFEAAFIASLGGAPERPAAEPAPPPAVVMPPAPPAPPPASTASPEALAWQSASAAGTPEAVLAYLVQYPRGLHSGDARAWLHARGITPPDERRVEPPPPPAPTAPPPRVEADDWRAAIGENRVEAYWTYLKHWPAGAHAAEARSMIGRLLYVPPASK